MVKRVDFPYCCRQQPIRQLLLAQERWDCEKHPRMESVFHDLPQATSSWTQSIKITHRFLDLLEESSISINLLDRYKEQLDSVLMNILQIIISIVQIYSGWEPMISQLDRMCVAIYWLFTWETLRICFLMRKIWIILQPWANNFWGSLVCINWLGGGRAGTLSGILNVIHLSCCHRIHGVWTEISKFNFWKVTLKSFQTQQILIEHLLCSP